MGLTVGLDNDNDVIHVHATGVVDAEMLMAHERQYWSAEELLGWHHFLDLRQCLLDIEHAELFTLAAHAVPKVVRYRGARTALVVADVLQRELVEFYQEARHELCPPAIREVGIFDDHEPARQWVLEATTVRVTS